MEAIFGKQVGQYVLLEKLGEGGMAAVYNAYDTRHERNVAIKLILPSRQTSQVFLERFAIEARALAQLSHVNIVRVLDYGDADGIPYLVMEFITGGTLKEMMGNPIPWTRAAAILAPIARALEYVHRQKIIHRDVKPSNILLDEDDTPLLSDFGVVKLLETNDTADALATGVGIGTPDYMSPEQGMGKEVDSRADIYALGVVYYEMITGQKPFTAETPMAVVIQHVTGIFPHPKAITPNLPRFVDDVVMRAVRKDPTQRFQRMSDFAEALEQLALGERANLRVLRRLVNSKRSTAAEATSTEPQKVEEASSDTIKAKSQRKRLKTMPILAALAFVLVASVLVLLFRPQLDGILGPISPTGTAVAAVQATVTTMPSRPTDMVLPTASLPATSTSTSTSTPRFTASPSPTITQTPTATPFPTSAMDAPIVLARDPGGTEPRKIAVFGLGGVTSTTWSEDGKTIILGTVEGLFGVDPETLMRLWYIDTLDWVTVLNSHPGDSIAAGLHSGEVTFWDYPGRVIGKSIENISSPSKGPVSALAASSDQRLLAVGWQSGGFGLYERQANGMRELFKKTWEQKIVTGLAFDESSTKLYVSSDNTMLEIWDIASQKQLERQEVGIRFDTIVPSGGNLLLYRDGLSAVIYGQAEKRVLYYFNNIGTNISAATVSPDSKLVAFGLVDGRIKVYTHPTPENQKTTTKEILLLSGHPDAITSLAFSPDSKHLASSSLERSLVLWDTTGTPLRVSDDGQSAVKRMAFSPKADQIAVQFGENMVELYDVSGKKIQSYEGILPDGQVFSSSGRYMVIAQPPGMKNPKGTLTIVELPMGNVIQTLIGYEQAWTVGFSQNEKLLASGYPLAAFVWDTSTWQKVETRRVVDSGCGIYNTAEGTHLATFWHDSAIFEVAQATRSWCQQPPDFASPLYLYNSQTMAIFQVRTGELWVWNFNDQEKEMMALKTQKWTTLKEPHTLLAMAPDNSFILWNQSNENLYISRLSSGWSTHNLTETLSIKNVGGYGYQGAIAPGGKIIALGTRFGTVSLWQKP